MAVERDSNSRTADFSLPFLTKYAEKIAHFKGNGVFILAVKN
jgi:hypothetical protein